MTSHAKRLLAVVAFAAITTSFHTTSAVNVFTEPVGFYKVNLLTNSDTFVSIPFTRTPEFRGVVNSVSGSAITVNGNPNWTAGQWAFPSGPQSNTYYAVLTSGAKEGQYYTITNNSANTLHVELVPEDLTGVTAGDRLRIIPFWTLNTVFPGGTGVVATVGALPTQRRTEIYFPAIGDVGRNLAATNVFFYLNGAWRKQGQPGTANYNHQIILPDQYFFARQNNTADTSTMMAPGHVVLHKLRIPLYGNPSPNFQDNYVAIYRPAHQTLNQSGLSNAFIATTSALPAGRKDELYVYDNNLQLRNKPATDVYYYFNAGWRKQGVSATVDFGESNVFKAASGYFVRKVTNAPPLTIWVNQPNYSND